MGAGATGCWVARELTAQGARVTLIDAGERHPSTEAVLRDPSAPVSFFQGEAAWQADAAARAPVQSQCRLAFGPATQHLFVDDGRFPYTLGDGSEFSWIRMRAVGGRMNLWSQICLRMSARDFSGASSSSIGWPITSEELAPHYARVERRLRVAGRAEGRDEVPDGELVGGQPSLAGAEARLREELAARFGVCLSWRRHSTLPRGSEVHALLAEAESTGRLALLPNRVVARVLVARSGRAAGVAHVAPDGAHGEVHARAVVLAASTLESVRILLLSTGERHPRGLGNHSGWLGRGVMDHLMAQPLVTAELPRAFGPACGYPFFIPFAGDGEGGFQLQGWLREEGGTLALAMYVQGEVRPCSDNFVELDERVRDGCGLPVAKLHFRYRESEARLFARVLETTRAMLALTGACRHELVERWRTPGSGGAGVVVFLSFNPRYVGINASLEEGIRLARRHGFAAYDLPIQQAESWAEPEALAALFASSGLRPGCWTLPFFPVGDEEAHRRGLSALPRQAAVARRIGATRTAMWILSSSDELSYDENFALHVARYRPIAALLDEHGIRLGLEFVGPKTSRRGRYEFVHDLAGARELCAAIGANVGLLFDSWHWYTSGGTLTDLESLTNRELVHVHVNDAPAGIARDDQDDHRRRLPCATGVIDLVGFVRALAAAGYDGPITAEPFDASLGQASADEAAAATRRALAEMMDRAGV